MKIEWWQNSCCPCCVKPSQSRHLHRISNICCHQFHSMGRIVWLQGVGACRTRSRGCEERLRSCTTAARDLDKALWIGHCFNSWQRQKGWRKSSRAGLPEGLGRFGNGGRRMLPGGKGFILTVVGRQSCLAPEKTTCRNLFSWSEVVLLLAFQIGSCDKLTEVKIFLVFGCWPLEDFYSFSTFC